MRKRLGHVAGVELLAVAGLMLGAAASAGPVHASAQQYVDDLRRAGVSVPGGDVELLEWGYEACKLLDLGRDYQTAKLHAVYNSQRTPRYGMTVEQADDVMHFAIADLCHDKT